MAKAEAAGFQNPLIVKPRKGLSYREPFNPRSPDQIRQLLDIFKIRVSKKTEKDDVSTDKTVLEELAKKFEKLDDSKPKSIFKDLLAIRELTKLHSAYLSTIPTLVNPVTGRIHPNFNQARAVTGRLSCDSPNLQQVPKRKEYGLLVRKGFVPKDGYVFIQSDWSQVELRILAHLANEVVMKEAFRQNRDLHSYTAKVINGYEETEEEIKVLYPGQRDFAKTLLFGKIYGLSKHGAAPRLGISVAEAEEILNGLDKALPGVQPYMDQCARRCSLKRYVDTMGGRRRRLIDKHGNRPYNWKNMAGNFGIQGTAADILKIAMNYIHAYFKENDIPARMLLTIHDEIIVEAREDQKLLVLNKVKYYMEHCLKLFGWKFDVPLTAEACIQTRWGTKL